MKLPINSLKEYTKAKLNIENILHILSSKIGEVEGVTNLSEMYDGIYVAKILSKKDHPNADKLAIYKVAVGKEEIQVVAGDKTLKEGDRVAYIKPGYIVPSTYKTSDEFKIKAVSMRGVLSKGMLCSEKELNIGQNHTNVLVLPSDAPVGKPFSKYYQLDDTVIDIENKALTNRGDLFGIIGLAREIAGAQNIPFESPQWYKENRSDIKPEGNILPIEINNESQTLCPRYMIAVLDNVQVKESPVWLKSILIRSGIKPINNIVDITNYLSVLTAQPLHAFDYDKLVSNDPNGKSKAQITVRLARDGERIHTLDNKIVELNSNHLVIADSTNPIAIAGVMGGMDTEVDENTKRIIIESASFNRFSIRKTSMDLGIFTEAVTRYTRGQHPQLCLPILLKAISLAQELSNGVLASNIVDSYPEPSLTKGISLSISRLNILLGTDISKEDVISILKNIEYTISEEKVEGDYITVVPPVFRTDILIPEDIYEDIGRIYGYENIHPTLPLRDITPPKKNREIELKKKIRSILSNSGCNEVDTYNFTSINAIRKSNQDPNVAYHIKNALSPELELMRTSLLPSLFDKAQSNLNRNIQTLCMYEFNIPHIKGYVDNFNLPKEDWHLSLLFSSKEALIDGNPYYEVKRYFEKIVNTLGIKPFEYELIFDSSEVDLPIWVKNILPLFSTTGAALIQYFKNGNKIIIGVIGDIDSGVKNNFKLPRYTAGFEINLEELKRCDTLDNRKIHNSKYPPITQDLCFTVNRDFKYKDLETIILDQVNARNRIATLECLDIYQKDSDVKNMTVRLSIEHMEKTLTDSEYEKLREKIFKKVLVLKN